mmetsp:Transcript_12912/g.32558  ORF Transcript_12912/g.32558 Transcript_12912/m.32558 type:complete len:522 (-) Transcript_12912:42-1607(-)
MVIANSDSNTTLVSLNNGVGDDKHHGSSEQKIVIDADSGLFRYVKPSVSSSTPLSSEDSTCSSDGGVQTELLISVSDSSSSSSSSDEDHIPLYLPLHERDQSSKKSHYALDIDQYISRNYYNIDNNDYGNNLPTSLPGAEILKASREQLLSSKRRKVCTKGQDRLLYVAQGERANATSEQYDVVMSDKATTCHILAFRSRISGASKGDLPLTSLTHLDGPQYEACVRDMVQEHLDHHRRDNSHNESRRKRAKYVEEEKKSDDCREPHEESADGLGADVTIDIHIMGGFDDSDSSSSSITDWLLRLLARMAKEFKDQRVSVQMVVKTLVVSSSNNTVDRRKNDSPIGRGLGINLQTGDVFLTDTQDDSSSNGPVSVLRSVRLWSRCCASEAGHSNRLSVVHTTKDVDDLWTSFGYDSNNDIRKEFSLFWVQPFRFRSISDADVLLGLPDELLLQYTSTSPDVEEAGFCKDVRASMAFLKHHCDTKNEDGSSHFGKRFDRPMVFAMRHSQDTKQREEWKRLSL